MFLAGWLVGVGSSAVPQKTPAQIFDMEKIVKREAMRLAATIT